MTLMWRGKAWWSLALILALTGCASVRPQELGHLVGTMAGGLLGGPPGAALGSLLGVALGGAVDRQIDQQQQKKERQVLAERMKQPSTVQPGTHAAIASPGELERVWVDEQVVNGRLVPGHFEVRPLVASR